MLVYCSYLKIKEMSVFAFSIENFSRGEDEIQYLMNLCHQKIKEIGQIEHVVIRVVGDLNRLD